MTRQAYTGTPTALHRPASNGTITVSQAATREALMRRMLLAVFSGVLILTSGPAAQARPDLSGQWQLVAEPGAGTPVFGEAFSITQNEQSIVIGVAAQRIRMSSHPDGRPIRTVTETGAIVRTTYVTDGADYVRPSADNNVGSLTISGEGSYRAVWSGGRLVVVQHSATRFARHGGSPTLVRRLVREALSLDDSGRLVVERLSVVDPVPESSEPFLRVEDPITQRSVYQRKSAP
jgi:hypothetical protein